MNVQCPECDAKVALPDELIKTGVPKVRCSGCGTRFSVAQDTGATFVLSGEPSGGTYEPGSRANSEGGAQSTEGDHSNSGPAGFDAPDLTRVGGMREMQQSAATQFDFPELPLGTVFRDKYRIDGEIGRGASAVVYRAHDTDTDLDVALKVVGVVGEDADHLRSAWAEEFKARRRVSDGAHLLHLESPVTEQREGVTYVALPQELGERSLRDWMNETAGDLDGRREQALAFFRQTCRGVAALHRADLAHLDLKPANLLLVRNDGPGSQAAERIKLGDFGLARNLAGLDASDAGTRRFGLGTPTYMAPEQIRSARFKDIGKPADFYALGVILHELIDGAPPFQGNADKVRQDHLETVPERPQDIPEEYWEIIERCLDKNLRRRLQDPAELEALLDAAPARGEEIRRKQAEAERKSREQRHEDRWRKANELRDADPERALEHIEAILNDPPVEDESRVTRLRSDLDALHQKAATALKKARKSELDKPIEIAIKAWNDVLKVVPRNEEANERLAALRERHKQAEEKFSKARAQADQGQFDSALKLLGHCLELDPNRDEIRSANEDIRQRQAAHDAALEKARRQLSESRPDLALKAAEKALAEASTSQVAGDIKEKAGKQLQKFDLLQTRAKEALTQARFDETREQLKQMGKLMQSSRKASAIETKLAEIEPAYTKAMEQATSSFEQVNLQDARFAVRSALERCPKSEEAQRLESRIERGSKTYSAHLEHAREAMRGGDFESARAAVDYAESLNRAQVELDELKEDIDEAEKEFSAAMAEADSAFQRGDLRAAFDSVEKALERCPEEDFAQNLQQQVVSRQKTSAQALDRAQDLLGENGHLEISDLHTRFFTVSEKLEEARKAWPLNPEIDEYEKLALERTTNFHERFNEIKSLIGRKKIDDARLAINELEMCELGCEIDEFKDTVQSLAKRNRAIKNKQINYLKKAGLVAGFGIPDRDCRVHIFEALRCLRHQCCRCRN